MKTPKPSDPLTFLIDAINHGNLDSALSLYEPEAVMVAEPGKLTNGRAGLRDALAGFIAMKPTLSVESRQIVTAGDIALSCAHWNLSGADPDGKEIKMSGRSSDILRRQTDGNWLFLIDNPWGTDILSAS